MGEERILKEVEKPVLKLDFGCGPNKAPGFTGVDVINFPGVDIVLNLNDKWPWDDNSVNEARASHFIEHLDAQERVHFVNELYRVLVPGGVCQLITPHWASCRAYGDPTHKWPPVSEFWFYYLNREWRAGNAPHTDIQHNEQGFNCNFDATWGYSLRQDVIIRNQEYQNFAIQNYKEVCQDTVANLVKKA